MHGRGVIEYWRPDFSFKAFRYVEVTGYPQPIEEGQSRICSAGTAMARTGHFRCSSEFLNKLYDVCLQTRRNNVLGQVVDCPHREQAQYLADTDLQAETRSITSMPIRYWIRRRRTLRTANWKTAPSLLCSHRTTSIQTFHSNPGMGPALCDLAVEALPV